MGIYKLQRSKYLSLSFNESKITFKKLGKFSDSYIQQYIMEDMQINEKVRFELISKILFQYKEDGFSSKLPMLIRDSLSVGIYYSQEGEDIVLERIFGSQDKGIFVDIGAHHPIRFSNTYALYLKGWRGINIDANPGSMVAFNHIRPMDLNIEAGVSCSTEALEYFRFEEPAINTFDENLAHEYIDSGCVLLEKVDVKTKTLKQILDDVLEEGTQIDLMSIDVEGYEYQALSSNDWEKYRPRVIVLERLITTSGSIVPSNDPLAFLEALNYQVVATLFNSIILTSKQ